MDAGCIITQPLYRIRKVIDKIGLYSPVSKGTIVDWTHPSTLDFLKVDKSLLQKNNLSGGIVAVNYQFKKAVQIIKRWKECALIKECIAPMGSNRTNHRQDQAVLTILADQSNITDVMPKQFLGCMVHRDVDKYCK